MNLNDKHNVTLSTGEIIYLAMLVNPGYPDQVGMFKSAYGMSDGDATLFANKVKNKFQDGLGHNVYVKLAGFISGHFDNARKFLVNTVLDRMPKKVRVGQCDAVVSHDHVLLSDCNGLGIDLDEDTMNDLVEAWRRR